jgi:hypothetical protein
MDYDDIVTDDGSLLADRLVRSMHRSDDGHLAINQKAHESSVESRHNVAILYIYTEFDDGVVINEHYVYSHKPNKYKEWAKIANDEAVFLEKHKGKDWLGVYGWQTSHVAITPLRSGDLFIKIDKQGATGVRLTFNSTKDKRVSSRGKK